MKKYLRENIWNIQSQNGNFVCVIRMLMDNSVLYNNHNITIYKCKYTVHDFLQLKYEFWTSHYESCNPSLIPLYSNYGTDA